MTLDDLTVNFAHLDKESLMDEWKWLIGEDYLPVLITKAGDAFLQNTKNDEVYFLNIVECAFECIANDSPSFNQMLNNASFVIRYFSVNLVASLIKSSAPLKMGFLYGWIKPPVLGGEQKVDNLEPTDIEVHFSILGQIWRQVKDLPEGTTINDVRIEE